MKKATLAVMIAVTLLVPMLCSAQSASGTLTVTATVQSSIDLVFQSNAAGVVLGGAGTNAASLAFGNISAFGALAANVNRVVGAADFTVSTPFNVLVNKYNTASANYTLTAQLGNADAVNTWALGATTISNAAASTLTATGGYGASTAYTLGLTVPFITPAATAISNTINFVATAN
jgi:hypothetical protein